MSESSTINVTHNQQRHDTEGNASSQLGVITPLQRTYTGQTLRTTTADSDSESTIVHTLSNEHDLLKEDERLVEGSSDKSQPQSRQSHDRSMCTKNMIHSKHTRPGSSTELRGQRVQSPSRSTLSSSVTATSCRTTASEAEFRSDLASLDADIARLQMQFRVATLTKLPKWQYLCLIVTWPYMPHMQHSTCSHESCVCHMTIYAMQSWVMWSMHAIR